MNFSLTRSHTLPVVFGQRWREDTMLTTLSDSGDPCARLRQLGLLIPDELDLLILPRGVDTAITIDELVHEADAATLRKLLAGAGLRIHQVRLAASAVKKSAEWIAPTIFVTSLLLTQNPTALPIALAVIESYVTDFLKGIVPERHVKLSFVVESSRSKTTKRLDYQGPVSGIRDLAQVIRELHDA